jgi:H+-translocating diphosphatase
MVGDCVGSSADVFESVAAEIIGAMILGSTLAQEHGLNGNVSYMLFPLAVHAMDILVSSVGIMTLRAGSPTENPMAAINRSYKITAVMAILGFLACVRILLHVEDRPDAWLHWAACGGIGIINGYIFIQSTRYYTDYEYKCVLTLLSTHITISPDLWETSPLPLSLDMGPISSLVLLWGWNQLSSQLFQWVSLFYFVTTSALLQELEAQEVPVSPPPLSHLAWLFATGLFGTAVATMGMLSSAVYVLAMNNFGPIADNAGGIAEMSRQPEEVRACTDRLDACGNVTKAITKAINLSPHSFALLHLRLSRDDRDTQLVPLHWLASSYLVPSWTNSLNMLAFPSAMSTSLSQRWFLLPLFNDVRWHLHNQVLIGGLLGTMMVFYFTGLSIAAVASAAQEVVLEVRRQIKENPDIMTYKSKPDYRYCHCSYSYCCCNDCADRALP